jgi:sporulation protein YlmC with PRC-barrel domain
LAWLVWSVLEVPAVSAQEAKPAKGSTDGNTSANVNRDQAEGPVRSARSLLDAAVKNRDGGEIGRIKDIGLNIGQGSVAAVFMMPTAPTGGKRELLSLPITALQWTSAGGDTVLDAQPDKPPAPSLSNDPNAKSRVVLFSTLSDIPVHNAGGDKLGNVVDFGLARQKGLISYAILVLDAGASSTDTLYPIPLAAFVVRANARQWILELPEGTLENTPTIKKGQWPTSVPRAWNEYVSVRYGHLPSGGVQTELRENK